MKDAVNSWGLFFRIIYEIRIFVFKVQCLCSLCMAIYNNAHVHIYFSLFMIDLQYLSYVKYEKFDISKSEYELVPINYV